MADHGQAQIVETAAGDVQVIDSGGDGPVVLFVHGTPGGCDQGALMGEFLVDAGLRVVAPSRPGYLGTPLTNDLATPAQHARLHGALMDTLGIERFGVMCWSGGGPSSYQLAADIPERVTAVAAVAAVSKPYTFEHPSQETILFGKPGAWLMKEMAKHSPKSTVKMLVTEEGDLPKDSAKELVGAIWEDETRREWVLRWLSTVTGQRKAGFNNDREQFPSIDLPLAAVTAPVLLVHANTDSDVPFEHSTHAADQLPNRELLEIPDGTHVSVWTGPDDVAVRARIVAHLR